MTAAIRIHTRVDSDTLRIPELASLIGKRVEVIILEDETAPSPPAPQPRKLGTLRGQFTIPDDFDAPLPDDVLRAFEGEGEG